MNAERRPPSCLVPIDRQIVGATVEASATMEIALTIPSKPNLTEKARVSAAPSPEAQVRRKMIEAIDTQIEAATAKSNGEVYIRRAQRWWTIRKAA